METTTFKTLYALARKGKLFGQITSEFDGMTDGMESVLKPVTQYTVEMLKKVKMTRNTIFVENDGFTLSNCCYRIRFTVTA